MDAWQEIGPPGPGLEWMRIFLGFQPSFRERKQDSTFNLLNHVVKKFMIHNVRMLTKVNSTNLSPQARCAFDCEFWYFGRIAE